MVPGLSTQKGSNKNSTVQNNKLGPNNTIFLYTYQLKYSMINSKFNVQIISC